MVHTVQLSCLSRCQDQTLYEIIWYADACLIRNIDKAYHTKTSGVIKGISIISYDVQR